MFPSSNGGLGSLPGIVALNKSWAENLFERTFAFGVPYDFMRGAIAERMRPRHGRQPGFTAAAVTKFRVFACKNAWGGPIFASGKAGDNQSALAEVAPVESGYFPIVSPSRQG